MVTSLLDLEGVERRELLAAARRRRFRRNEIIFHEGDRGDALHLVVKGYVAIRLGTALGDTVTLEVHGPGSPFGELALITTEAVRTATAIALESTETLTWQRDQVAELRERSPEFDRFLLDIMATRVQNVTAHLMEALHLPVEQRVLRRLSGLVALYGPESQVDDAAVTIPVTQEDLAFMAGTTRPTTNRVLKETEARGLIALARGRITILDPVALARRAHA